MHHDQVPIDPQCIERFEDFPFKLGIWFDRQVEPGMFVCAQDEKIGVGTKEMVAILNVFRVVPVGPIRLH
jgi:hypothetical protein